MRMRKGDIVKITGGNEKGKQGKVLAAFPRAGKIVVEGIRIKKKHMRPRRQGQKGEITSVPSAFPASRAMLICPKCGKPARIGADRTEHKNTRVCKQCRSPIETHR